MNKFFPTFVGTYTESILFGSGKILEGKGEGVYIYQMARDSGKLKPVKKIQNIKNPSFLTYDSSRKVLYTVNELKEYKGEETGTVSSFKIDPCDSENILLNRRRTRGQDPCYLTLDRSKDYLLTTNYSSGSISVFSIRDDGSIGERSDFVSHEGSSKDPNRQEGPHVHSIFLDYENKFAYAPDLGLDELVVYKFNSECGILESCPEKNIKIEPGSGPRHFALNPEKNVSYLINELNSTVNVFNFQETDLKNIQTISTLPPNYNGENYPAEIKVHPSGKYVYGSNRGHDSIVIYKVNFETGKLRIVGYEPTKGKNPRHFDIDPSGRFLLVANQDSNNIVTFEINQETGRLNFSGQVVDVPTPVCVNISKPAEQYF